MSTDRPIRWTAISALAVSCFALGFSVWSVGRHGSDAAAVATREVPTAVRAEPAKVAPPAAAPAVTPADKSGVHADIAPAEPTPPAVAPRLTDPSAAGLEVKRLVVTRGVAHREPLDTNHITAGAGPVFAFVELENTTDADKVVTVDFQHGTDAPVGHIKLKVPAHSSRWRTWGRTRMVDQAGQWTAIVSAGDGTELAHTGFDVQAPES